MDNLLRTSGTEKHLSLRFSNRLSDAVIERFGTTGDVFSYPDGKDHFIVNAEVAVSDQFFGWIVAFRDRATIVSPPDVVAAFQSFLSDIAAKYRSE